MCLELAVISAALLWSVALICRYDNAVPETSANEKQDRARQEVHSDTLKMALSRDGHDDKFLSVQSVHRGSVCVKARTQIKPSSSRILPGFSATKIGIGFFF